jgi:NDP-sugar pyrophosphorylase family protein
MPIVDKPILEIIIAQLAAQGIKHITLAVNYQAEILSTYVSDGSKWKVRVDYSLEAEPLGTMGPLKLIPDLPETFLVLNGDVLTDLNYANFVRSHAKEGGLFTISAAACEQKIDFGVLEVGEGRVLRGFHEKPSVPYLVSMGVYCLNRRVLDWIPEGRPFGFDQLVLELLARGQPIRAVTHDGYWLDIGRPDDYEKAIEDWPRLSMSIGL